MADDETRDLTPEGETSPEAAPGADNLDALDTPVVADVPVEPAKRGFFSRMMRRHDDDPDAPAEGDAQLDEAQPSVLTVDDDPVPAPMLRPAPPGALHVETREVEVRAPRPTPPLPFGAPPIDAPSEDAPAQPELELVLPETLEPDDEPDTPKAEADSTDADTADDVEQDAADTSPGSMTVEVADTSDTEVEAVPEALAAVVASPEEAPGLRRPVPLTAHMAVITALATAVTLAFVLVEPSPRWWLILGAAAVIAGMDGVLRAAWREPFEAGQETAPFLFLPALYILVTPVLIEHNARGEWVLLMGLAGGLGFGAIVWGEVASVRTNALEYPRARLVTTSAAYFTAFGFFSLTYVFQVGLLTAMVAVGLAATMLAIELLREGEIDPLETLGFAVVTGLVVAEGRWLMHYLPLDGYMAGLALLVLFYFVTGVVHSYITREFNPRLALEYGGIAAIGLTLVAAARAAGLA